MRVAFSKWKGQNEKPFDDKCQLSRFFHWQNSETIINDRKARKRHVKKEEKQKTVSERISISFWQHFCLYLVVFCVCVLALKINPIEWRVFSHQSVLVYLWQLTFFSDSIKVVNQEEVHFFSVVLKTVCLCMYMSQWMCPVLFLGANSSGETTKFLIPSYIVVAVGLFSSIQWNSVRRIEHIIKWKCFGSTDTSIYGFAHRSAAQVSNVVSFSYFFGSILSSAKKFILALRRQLPASQKNYAFQCDGQWVSACLNSVSLHSTWMFVFSIECKSKRLVNNDINRRRVAYSFFLAPKDFQFWNRSMISTTRNARTNSNAE